jgi:hypothetical protein
VLVIVRWATDRWAVASAQADSESGKRIGKTKTPYVLGVLVLPMCVGDPIVGEYADVTARRSVTHLTFADTFGRSVPTCSVLLHAEAGGMPAFQSGTALRRTLWYNGSKPSSPTSFRMRY